ncbi:MAG: hypothetical protein DMG06_23130 [Acidobacteria bacterium]|nr:MAG: hypothetical protein DMG06_23130 [Acidobacteriota bacterium]
MAVGIFVKGLPHGGPLHGGGGSSKATGGLMEKWIPSLPLWKSVSAHGKPPGNPSAPKLASRAVSHRPLPFPTAAKGSRAPLSHRPYGELFYLQNNFLFLTQADISFAKKGDIFTW